MYVTFLYCNYYCFCYYIYWNETDLSTFDGFFCVYMESKCPLCRFLPNPKLLQTTLPIHQILKSRQTQYWVNSVFSFPRYGVAHGIVWFTPTWVSPRPFANQMKPVYCSPSRSVSPLPVCPAGPVNTSIKSLIPVAILNHPPIANRTLPALMTRVPR